MNMKDVVARMESSDTNPLENEADLEEYILLIKSIDEKVDWYKKLRQERAKKIADEIDKLEGRKNTLKQIIGATLQDNGRKSLNFPGVGKVSVSTKKAKWVINDEDALLKRLKEELSGDIIDKVVKTKESISKAELKKLLDTWEKSNDVPPEVERGKDSSSVAVTLDKDVSPEQIQEVQEEVAAIEAMTVSDFDGLKI